MDTLDLWYMLMLRLVFVDLIASKRTIQLIRKNRLPIAKHDTHDNGRGLSKKKEKKEKSIDTNEQMFTAQVFSHLPGRAPTFIT